MGQEGFCGVLSLGRDVGPLLAASGAIVGGYKAMV